ESLASASVGSSLCWFRWSSHPCRRRCPCTGRSSRSAPPLSSGLCLASTQPGRPRTSTPSRRFATSSALSSAGSLLICAFPMTLVLHYMAIFFAILAGCGLGYLLLTLWSIHHFRRTHSGGDPNFTPPVSILKPLKGADPEMYESFRSHCVQDYPAGYEIIFGVNDLNDPAVAEVERIRREFPDRDIRLVVCPATGGTNRKVTNLVQMVGEAKS